MASDDWDADTFEPASFTTGNPKWEGEDEDDDVKDNWDDVDEEEKDKDTEVKESQPVIQPVKVKKKKPLKEIIAEKEEKEKNTSDNVKEQATNKPLTPEEALAEKIRQQQLQEESDLQVAKETFGVTNDVVHGIETMHPTNAEEFNIFRKALVDVVTKYDRSSYYIPFLDALFREVCLNLEADDIKKLGNTLHILANEKVKAAKGTKAKKKAAKVKASLVVGRANDYNDYGGEYEEFDDFM